MCRWSTRNALALLFVGVLAASGGIIVMNPVSGTSLHTDSLVTEWPFDEGSGDAHADNVGLNDGELGSAAGADANDPDWVTEGLDFVAASADRTRIANFFNPGTDGAFSLMFMVEITGDSQNLYSQENGSGTGRSWIFTSSGNVCTLIGGISVACVAYTTGWHTVVLMKDATTGLSMRLDCGTAATATRTPESATGQHKIGVNKNNSSGWNGSAAYALFYNDVITQGECQQNHNFWDGLRGVDLP